MPFTHLFLYFVVPHQLQDVNIGQLAEIDDLDGLYFDLAGSVNSVNVDHLAQDLAVLAPELLVYHLATRNRSALDDKNAFVVVAVGDLDGAVVRGHVPDHSLQPDVGNLKIGATAQTQSPADAAATFGPSLAQLIGVKVTVQQLPEWLENLAIPIHPSKKGQKGC